jgi:hypothetical protein
MKIETGKKYVQRNGEVVTCLTDKAAGAWPVIVEQAAGGLTRRLSCGCIDLDSHGPLDLVSEYVEPRKAVEAWAVFANDIMLCAYNYRDSAVTAAKKMSMSEPTIHHLREVNPAREKAVEELVAAVRDGYNCCTERMVDALDALDAAEGVK